ncbi:cystathionine beta-lyase MetC [Gottschalkia acidurici 9a]|uniref:L-methionine gamma-lyase n=1 Tax=Gottschalkia acidurici (strain ATCC 7906 / DSM 604 / BCRC 14475 / CIP 104303 / KCTC 5404 / NCIMB 10678 / 9a) TaxID=1128398 RepID=K0AZ70_GOTA9|nr:aminotransferase class I/II-fold pyridoxal phosphate-dependent enzyme [Gottschalkia acidurici]AFS79093.1 cystathionine beta-lyase MetC [Gottschalkia acidurici 9a]
MAKDYKFDTLSIHGGREEDGANYPLNPPIYQSSTFVFGSTDDVNRMMSGEMDGYLYSRGENPTVRLFEERIAALEEGVGAVAFASGMAAVSSVMLSLLRPEDNIIVHNNLYGSSYILTTSVLPDYNINFKIVDLTNIDNLKESIDENTKVIYFETPSNPNLTIIDIKAVVDLAKEKGIKVVVDNTFATPYFQKPLTQGVDVVVHSATKYIGGHGDVIAGVAIANDKEYLNQLNSKYLCKFGGVMSAFNAWLLLRGLKTLGLRMRQHEENAIKVADFLESHPKIKEVMYPGLKSFKGHELAKKQMSGFGAMISFEVKGDLEEAKDVVNSVKLSKLAVSLGDCETLIELPAAMTHSGYPKEELSKFGLTESMIRLSVGLENAEDIIKDLDNALSYIYKKETLS